MSGRTSGQETGPTAPSVPQNASTGTSDAERIAALEAELAECRSLAEKSLAPDHMRLAHWGITYLLFEPADVERLLARPAGTAAARVIAAACALSEVHGDIVGGRFAIPTTAMVKFVEAVDEYQAARS